MRSCYDPRVDPVERVRLRAREDGKEVEREDALAVEEPLEIRVRAPGNQAVARFVTTMRTPGHDEELAAGLLFTEGIIHSRADLRAWSGAARHAHRARAHQTWCARRSRRGVTIARKRLRARELLHGVEPAACAARHRSTPWPRGPVRPSAMQLRIRADVLRALPARAARRDRPYSSRPAACTRRACSTRAATLRRGARGRRPPQRGRQADRPRAAGRRDCRSPARGSWSAAGRASSWCRRPARRHPGPGLGLGALEPGGRAGQAAGMTLLGFVRERRFNVYAHDVRIER